MAHLPPPEILFDDEALFAVLKPAEVHSVMQQRSPHPSVAEALLQQEPTLAASAPRREDAGLINRLDYDTSGVLLGAKTPQAWAAFSKLLKSGGITKQYSVILEGKLTARRTIEGWIGSPYRSGSKVRVYDSAPRGSVRALPACTTITPVHYDLNSDTTYALVHCPVARRHQVRAHCAAAGHPLLGDTLYGATRALRELAPAEESRGFFLHAGSVNFLHPLTQEPVSINAALPQWIETRYRTGTADSTPTE